MKVFVCFSVVDWLFHTIVLIINILIDKKRIACDLMFYEMNEGFVYFATPIGPLYWALNCLVNQELSLFYIFGVFLCQSLINLSSYRNSAIAKQSWYEERIFGPIEERKDPAREAICRRKSPGEEIVTKRIGRFLDGSEVFEAILQQKSHGDKNRGTGVLRTTMTVTVVW